MRSLEEDHGQAGRRETIEEKVVRMYQVPGRCREGRISGELYNCSPFSQRGKGRGEERELRVQWAGGGVNLHTDKGTGLPTRRSSGMERLKVHSWLLTTASVTEKEL